ncbi:UPF0175 family protein [Halalkalicoccus salilacus]|uniref:UPF0175 family protein n=1 Tax=Halalkalicoccus TaxID=332246 RepID=UPI002F96A604
MRPDPLENTEGNEELATVIGLYALGELTMGQAAERLDISRFRMQEILHDTGIELRLGPSDIEDASDEVDVALDLE